MSAEAFVVAVSGISGAGKSRVVERAVELLGPVAAGLHFDAYRAVSTYPGDLEAWLEEGADPDVWKTPRLAADLAALRRGEAVRLPEGGRVVGPAEVVVIEEPFGRLRRELAGLIDLVAHLDVPADVLLARRLARRLDEERHLFGERFLDQLREDLETHLSLGRRLDALGNEQARKTADLVLDGTRSVDEIAAELVAEIGRVRSRR